MDCIRSLCRQNFAFRGHREILSSTENTGNFLELVKFLGNYDPVVREHRTRIKPNRTPCHISRKPPIIISILGHRVLAVLLDEVRKAKYYSIIFNSTPDVAHADQMSQVLRYINISGRKVEVKETFIDFIEFGEKNAEALTNQILAKLRDDHLDIHNIRGQGYDNAATMAINSLATYVPCSNHSLNLAGVTYFFGTMDRLFLFFSASTHRWDVFKHQVTGKTVKRTCETRWRSRHEAVDAVASSLESITAALEQLRDGDHETADTRSDAAILLSCMMSCTFIAYLAFSRPVLREINDVQIFLQTPGLGLDSCATKCGALVLFCEEEREKVFEEVKAKATTFCGEEMGVPTERRVQLRRRIAGESAEDAGLSLQADVRREQLQIIDQQEKRLETGMRSLNGWWDGDMRHRFRTCWCRLGRCSPSA